MSQKLAGRVALVTGASSGIGEATAYALAHAGIHVAVSARRLERLQALVGRIQASTSSRAIAIPGDIADEPFAERAVAKVLETFGRIDILINCAGIIQAGSIEQAISEEWRRTMDINFFGAVWASRAVIPHLKRNGSGDIVNVSSTSGRRLSAVKFGAYAPSKHALNSFSEALRLEVSGHGIRVCVIEPGATATECAEGMSDAAAREVMRAHVSKEGSVLPQEVADTIVFVLSQPPRTNICEVMIRPTNDLLPL